MWSKQSIGADKSLVRKLYKLSRTEKGKEEKQKSQNRVTVELSELTAEGHTTGSYRVKVSEL